MSIGAGIAVAGIWIGVACVGFFDPRAIPLAVLTGLLATIAVCARSHQAAMHEDSE